MAPGYVVTAADTSSTSGLIVLSSAYMTGDAYGWMPSRGSTEVVDCGPLVREVPAPMFAAPRDWRTPPMPVHRALRPHRPQER